MGEIEGIDLDLTHPPSAPSTTSIALVASAVAAEPRGRLAQAIDRGSRLDGEAGSVLVERARHLHVSVRWSYAVPHRPPASAHPPDPILSRRYARKADRFLAFTSLACALICYRTLQPAAAAVTTSTGTSTKAVGLPFASARCANTAAPAAPPAMSRVLSQDMVSVTCPAGVLLPRVDRQHHVHGRHPRDEQGVGRQQEA
ncbi:hypothetical protein [Streptomyces sp. NPDC012756]|uniref:hypothetical protein n=1 Tax=Streptomyces sp. NPDC012756 TaxID=3364847 RepID=UPI0036CB4ACD